MSKLGMSLTFNAVFGVVPGYPGHNEDHPELALGSVVEAWNIAMEREWEFSGLQISSLCKIAHAVYPNKHGCPIGGEVVVEVTGVLNPHFVEGRWEDERMEEGEWLQGHDLWHSAVKRVVNEVKTTLQQTRVTLFFQKVLAFHYLQD